MKNNHVSTHINIAIQTLSRDKTPHASIYDNDEILQFFARHGFTGKCRNEPVSIEILNDFLSAVSPVQPGARDFYYEVKALLGAVLPGETLLLCRTPLTPWDGTGDFREWAG